MPNPTSSSVHVNRPLTQISVAYIQGEEAFVGHRVFPSIPVTKQADRYFRYDRADFWRNQMAKRAPSTESAGGGWKVDSTPNFYCDRWALHKDIDDELRANTDDPLSMDRDATLWLTQQSMISREVEWAANFFTTGIWTGVTGSAQDITGVASDSPSTNQVAQWNRSSSTPIVDVKTQADNIQGLTGFRPNKFVMGRLVWTKLSEHDDVIARIQYSSGNNNPAIVSKQAVAALMEIGEVMVADGIQATSTENPSFETAMTISRIIGKAGLLVYAAPAPSILVPSGGYTFNWTGLHPGATGPFGNVVSSFRMQNITSDRIEIEQAYDQKLVASDCGIYFTTLIA